MSRNPGKKSGDGARRRRHRPVQRPGAPVAARCYIDLQPRDEVSAFEDPSALLDAILEEPTINRELVRRVLKSLDLPVRFVDDDAIDTRVHDDLPVRLILDGHRAAVTFDLPKGTGEDLPACLDAIFDLCFSLAQELDLEVYDPQSDRIITPNQYERRFAVILESYQRRQQIAEALGKQEQWRAVDAKGAQPPDRSTGAEAPVLRVPRGVFPSRRRALRGRFGPVEVAGEIAIRAIREALDADGVLVLVEDDPRIEGEAQLARVSRYLEVQPGLWLVEFQAMGRRRIESVAQGLPARARVSAIADAP